MISFARQDLIIRPIEKRLYLFADERSEGENKFRLMFRNIPFINANGPSFYRFIKFS